MAKYSPQRAREIMRDYTGEIAMLLIAAGAVLWFALIGTGLLPGIALGAMP